MRQPDKLSIAPNPFSSAGVQFEVQNHLPVNFQMDIKFRPPSTFVIRLFPPDLKVVSEDTNLSLVN